MNIKTIALTEEQYINIIETLQRGSSMFRSNNRIATILVLEANLGLRISDILTLKLDDVVKDGERYRLDIVEKKTGKKRMFTVPFAIYQYLENYCLKNNISSSDVIFKISERSVQKQLKIVCDYLGYENISTHSFRKFFATQIYINNNYNIALVQQLLQHSSISVTQKYIGIQQKDLENALMKHINLL